MNYDDARKQKEIDLAWAAHRAERTKAELAQHAADHGLSQQDVEISMAWAAHRALLAMPVSANRMRLRERVSAEQNHRCCFCGIRTNEARNPLDMASFEHVIPRSKGGRDSYENCVMSCRRCNGARGDRPLIELEP